MNTTPVDSQRESLALSVACGRSVRLWAKHHDVEFTMAFEWYMQQEFRDASSSPTALRVADRAFRWADCSEGRDWRSASLSNYAQNARAPRSGCRPVALS